MCGRFVSESPPDEIARYFSAVDLVDVALEPSWNVAPTDDIYVVVGDGTSRRLDAFHWGLVPHWAKDIPSGNRMINARAETLAVNGAYKPAFGRRRCLIPADGFYEWKAVPGKKKKQPFFIHRPDGDLYAFAGLWETWRRPDGAEPGVAWSDRDILRSATIITTTANPAMAELHDRMPVILPAGTWDTWLDRGNHDLAALGELLVPAPPELTMMHPVASDVGNVRSNGAHLIDRIEPTESNVDGAQATLL